MTLTLSYWKKLGGSTFWLYKGPRGTIHAAYHFDEADDTLRINRVWTNHDEYEAAAEAGRGFFDDPGAIDWVDWTDRLHETLG